jgi:hypothetical protein
VSLELNNFKVETQQQYADMMTAFQDGFKVIGEHSSHENLAYSLLQWMSYIKYYYVADPSVTDFKSVGYGQLQFMQLTGTHIFTVLENLNSFPLLNRQPLSGV